MKVTHRELLLRGSFVAALSGSTLIATAMPLLAAAAGNLDAHLRGSYAFTSTRTCAVSLSPMDENNNYAFAPDRFYQTSTDSGIYTFNGDGTGSSVGKSRNVNLSAGSGTLVNVSSFTSDFSYTVNDDRTVDVSNFLTTFNGTFPNVNFHGTITGQAGRLQITDGETMLVTAPSEAYTVETLNYTAPLITQYRICTRSTTATKLPGK
jgi:hypothetical protein